LAAISDGNSQPPSTYPVEDVCIDFVRGGPPA
jgi:hypothetical protein